MRAVVIKEFGGPDVLRLDEVPDQPAGAGEVVIDVELANVTFVDTQIRAGRPPNPAMLPALPAVLGNGVGGTVAEAGPGAAPGPAGRRVVTALTGTGGYADRAVAAAQRLIEVPDEVELRDAVALLADGRTALALMDSAQIAAGDTVLIEAAAGGVGTLLVQLARNAGARVVALAGQERKLATARALGADLVIDYSTPDWPNRVRAVAGQVDAVFDGVGGDIGLAAFGLLGAGGRFCPFGMASGSFTPVSPELARKRGVTVAKIGPVSAERLRTLSQAALNQAAAGRIRPVIGQEFELSQAAAAHAAIEARTTTGKTLLTVAR
jgi:NADPH2:quinone reductase